MRVDLVKMNVMDSGVVEFVVVVADDNEVNSHALVA